MATATAGSALSVNYKLGEYAIQAVLGQGGFGITYLAQDTRLNTQVAIKEYFPQAYATRAAGATIQPNTTPISAVENYEWGLSEFLKEAQALARFKHPHIVRVLRFLEANGTAYMVMEYEEGESLLAYLRRSGGHLTEPMLLNIFIPVLTGLQAVHDAGLLHLDIKPDNIYLRKNGQPMLIDFGSSRQARDDAAAEQKVTLSRGYAAPEQYPGQGERGPWSDVYGMGAALYRCITGREPMDAIEREQIQTKKLADPLMPASTVEHPHYAAHIRAATDAALTLAAEERPRSARALQNGLMGKELKDEQAKPWVAYGRGAGFIGVASAAMQLGRRRRTGRPKLERAIAFLVFGLAMLVVVPKLMIDSQVMTQDDLYAYIDDIQNEVRSVPRRSKQFVDEVILGAKPLPTPPPVVRPRAPVAVAAAVRNVAPFDLGKQTVRTLNVPAAPLALAFLAEGRIVAAALDNGLVQLWNTETGERLRTFSSLGTRNGALVASADGRALAYADADNTIHIWSASEDQEIGALRGHAAAVYAVAFSADGKWLASSDEDRAVMVWDVDSGTVLHTFKARAIALALTFAPNGRILAAADVDGGIHTWEMPSGSELAYTTAQSDALTTLAYSPDGKWLAGGGQRGFAKLWRIGMERAERSVTGVPAVVNVIAFSPDGKWLLLAGATDAIEIRNVETGEVGARLAGHARAVRALAVSADGQRLASGDDDKKIRLWR